jgi:hypothetical protein
MRRSAVILGAACLLLVVLAASASAKVLRVGTYHGAKGQYKTIQAAVDHARAGDWILVAPGDYKTTHYVKATDPDGGKVPAAVMVKRPDIFIRGMNRNTVIVDGTKSGPVCNAKEKDQNFGPNHEGLNGIEVFKADNDWVQNLTTCNFLSGPNGDTGNEIWWNGGAGGGHIHGIGFIASYLNATSTYYKNESTASTYGLFSSDWSGGVFEDDYASNFNDAGYYIGGCAQKCDQQILHSQSEYNALGYSGTNSGGSMLFAYNKFDHNKDGFDTNSQNNSDWPSPQNGACLKGVKPEIKGAKSCWILYKNQIYDNNDASVPEAGAAAQGPVGTGASIEGENDTIMDNTIKDNGAWGVVFEPYPDTGTAPPLPTKAGMACHGGTPNFNFLGTNINCMYEASGDNLLRNTFSKDGFFGNFTNGDFQSADLEANQAENCFIGNKDTSGTLKTVTKEGSDSESSIETDKYLQATYDKCGTVQSSANSNLDFLLEAACDTNALGPGYCIDKDHYPRSKKVVMHKLPTKQLKTMKNPCAGVPANPWCPARKKKK